MGERSQTPGLIARKRKSGPDRLYWNADNVSRKAKGYPDRLIPLPDDGTDEEIVDLCQTYTERLLQWHQGPRPRWLYDGTVGSLCDAFERHPQSPIRDVRRSTAESYIDSLKVIRATVAKRAIRALTRSKSRAGTTNGGRLDMKKDRSGSSAPMTRFRR